MSKVYHKLFYHAVWSTHKREPLITPKIENVLYPFMQNKAKRFHCILHGIGGTDDHLHAPLEIPPSESVSDIVGKLKGSASYFLNKELQVTEDFGWQDGFGVLSFAQKDLPKVLQYIRNQKQHHKSGALNRMMEQMEVDDEK